MPLFTDYSLYMYFKSCVLCRGVSSFHRIWNCACNCIFTRKVGCNCYETNDIQSRAGIKIQSAFIGQMFWHGDVEGGAV